MDVQSQMRWLMFTTDGRCTVSHSYSHIPLCLRFGDLPFGTAIAGAMQASTFHPTLCQVSCSVMVTPSRLPSSCCCCRFYGRLTSGLWARMSRILDSPC